MCGRCQSKSIRSVCSYVRYTQKESESASSSLPFLKDQILTSSTKQMSYVAPVFVTCNGLSKSSILTFYLQISPQKLFKMSIWTAIGVVTCYTVTIAGVSCVLVPADQGVVGSVCVRDGRVY